MNNKLCHNVCDFFDKKMKDDLISYSLFLNFILHWTSGDAD